MGEVEVSSLKVAVSATDQLRAERLTRSLKRELDAVDGVVVRYTETQSSTPEHAKGGVLQDALEVSIVGVWPVCAPLLAETVKAWLHREPSARVRITADWDHLEIDGDPTPEQAKLLHALLERRDGE
jgi:hypothetical protein